MARNSKWQDDYYLLLMQIYLRRPVGVKPMYCRDLVTLGLELHIHPKELSTKMQQISKLDTPRIERIWNTYHENPRKLARAVRLLREMKGFGRADEFYEGVAFQADHGDRNSFYMTMKEDFERPPIYNVIFEAWGLDTGSDWDKK